MKRNEELAYSRALVPKKMTMAKKILLILVVLALISTLILFINK